MLWRSSVALSSRESGLFISIFLMGLGVPVVQRAQRRDAAKFPGLVAQSRLAKQLLYSGMVRCAHRFLVRVRAEGLDFAADVDHRLVQGIAKRIACVAADDDAARLRHEGRVIADAAADDDIDALHGDAAAQGSIPVNDEQPAMRGRA